MSFCSEGSRCQRHLVYKGHATRVRSGETSMLVVCSFARIYASARLSHHGLVVHRHPASQRRG
jgi:hypothetical protein